MNGHLTSITLNMGDLLLGRGYTGHEHLPWFGLVNMNARLYDPAVGRFLSPDPLIQAPDNTQSYNRYSYCLNNPLRYTDQSGLSRSEYYPDPDQNGEVIYWHIIPDFEIEVSAESPSSAGRSRFDGGVIYFYVNMQPFWTPNPYIGMNDGGSMSSRVVSKTSSVSLSPSHNVLQPSVYPIAPDWPTYSNIASYSSSYAAYLLENSGYQSYALVMRNGTAQLKFSRVRKKSIYWSPAHSVPILAKNISRISSLLGLVNLGFDTSLAAHALEENDYEAGIQYSIDVCVDALSSLPCPQSIILGIAWSLGLREVNWMCIEMQRDYIVLPEYHRGTLGRIDTFPFK